MSETRVEAAARALISSWGDANISVFGQKHPRAEWRRMIRAALTAADEAEPMMPASESSFLGRTAEQWAEIVGDKADSEDRLLERVLRAEAAARDLAEALDYIQAAVHSYEMTEGRPYWNDLLAARAKAVVTLEAYSGFRATEAL